MSVIGHGAVELAQFFPPEKDGGRAGWMIYLKPGWSFDSSGVVTTRFVPVDRTHEIGTIKVYRVRHGVKN